MANKINKISEETIQKIKQKSVLYVPDRPGEKGMTAAQLKQAFVGLVTDSNNSTIAEVNRMADEINDAVNDIVDKQDNLDFAVNELIDNGVVKGVIATDIENKLNQLEKDYAPKLATIDYKKADKSYVENITQSLASGSPKGVYNDLQSLQIAKPNGDNNIYLTSNNGHWNYWDGFNWISGGVYQSSAIANKSIDQSKIKDKSIIPANTIFVNQSINLFNKDDSEILDGYYYSGGGVKTAYADALISGKIYVSPNQKFIIPHQNIFTQNMIGACFTSDDVFVSNLPTEIIANNRIITIPANSTIAYMKVNIYSKSKENYMVIEGTNYPETYIPFAYELSHYFKFNKPQIKELENITDVTFRGKLSLPDRDLIKNAVLDNLHDEYVDTSIFLPIAKNLLVDYSHKKAFDYEQLKYKHSVSFVDSKDGYIATVAVYISPENLQNVGLELRDTNYDTINLRALYNVSSFKNLKDQRIYFGIRYGGRIEGNLSSTDDVLLQDGINSAVYLGLGDDIWLHDNVMINNSKHLGAIKNNVIIPATYKNRPFTGIFIFFIANTVDKNLSGSYIIEDITVTKETIVNEDITFENQYKNVSKILLSEGNLNQNLKNKINNTSSKSFDKYQVKIGNTDKIIFFGDSFTEGFGVLKGKAYINKLSLFSDYNFENYSKSGDDLGEINQRLKNDIPKYHHSITPKNMNGTYAVIISNENDSVYYNTENGRRKYFDNLTNLCESVKSLGMKPIISTEFGSGSAVIEARFIKGLKSFAERHGYGFIDIYTKTKLFNSTSYSGFWQNGHPALRTNHLFSDNIQKFLDTLPRPKQSLKIFRKRESFEINHIDDLIFNTIDERAERFKEIYVGHTALTDDKRNYYDSLNIDFKNSEVVSEYLKLQNNETVNFSDYALIDAVLPSTPSKMYGLKLKIDNGEVKVYVNNVKAMITSENTSSPEFESQFEKPKGKWIEIPNEDGVCVVEDLLNSMSYDKVSFLLYKQGGFNLSDISIEWEGTKGKDITPHKKPIKDSYNVELLQKGTFEVIDGCWVVDGTLSPYIPADNVLPFGITKCVDITPITSINTTIDYDVDYEKTRIIQVKVWARYFPPIFDYTQDFNTSQITEDSFDYAKLSLEVVDKTSNQNSYNFSLIGLHWNEYIFDILIPSFTDSQTIKLTSLDKAIQIAKVSAKFLND